MLATRFFGIADLATSLAALDPISDPRICGERGARLREGGAVPPCTPPWGSLLVQTVFNAEHAKNAENSGGGSLSRTRILAPSR